MYFYDIDSQVFLVEGVHNHIPENAIRVTENEFRFLVDGRNKGKDIVVMSGALTLTPMRPTTAHEWNGQEWVLSEEKRLILLESQRQQVRDAINALRDKKINGGVYVPAIKKWIDSDARAVQNLLSVKATFDLFGDDLEIVWTCADNSNIKMTKEVMLQIWQAMQHNINTNHGNAISHKNALEQSENPLGYDYSSGWTQTYEEFAGAENE